MLRFFTSKSNIVSDAELLEAYCQKGNMQALGMLYERYMHLVYGVCMKYLKNRHDAQDAVMGIFEKLQKELLKHQIQDFKPWLQVTTRNYCLMKLRGTRWEVGAVAVEIAHLSVENDYLLHLNENSTEEQSKALQGCIEKLMEQQRLCVELFYLKERSYRQISEELHFDLNEVKSYIQNGKRNLKLCIEKNIEKSA